MSGGGPGRSVCAGIRELLAAALANEIPAGRADAVRDHLERCEACRRHRDFEIAFDGALTRGLKREEVDPALSDRIRDALRREDARVEAGSWGRTGPAFKVLAAVAATLFVAVVSYGVARRAGAPAAPIAPAHPAFEQVRTGVLVCASCERGGAPTSAQTGCRAFGHHAALRCERDGLWEFVESDKTMSLLTDADRIGRAIEVRGVFFEDIHYVRVSSYRYLPEGAPGAPSGSGL